MLNGMWDELEMYLDITVCPSGSSSRVAKHFFKEKEDKKINQFLMGLNEGVYRTMRSQILNNEPLSPLSKIYAMIVHEERNRASFRIDKMHTKAAALHASTKNKHNKSSERGKPICKHCKKPGHDILHCWEKMDVQRIRTKKKCMDENQTTRNFIRPLKKPKLDGNLSLISLCFTETNNEEFDWTRYVWGPYHTASASGVHYFFTLVDNYSRCMEEKNLSNSPYEDQCKDNSCLVDRGSERISYEDNKMHTWRNKGNDKIQLGIENKALEQAQLIDSKNNPSANYKVRPIQENDEIISKVESKVLDTCTSQRQSWRHCFPFVSLKDCVPLDTSPTIKQTCFSQHLKFGLSYFHLSHI
ncbi:hypothetical protein CDL12_17304 [Handroanthus impetiginosus]|uniref:Uncharacterized protein n=1 Tax=Handroanthus impetiginosus TaxID=429701 RepID=A0A2G9GYM2_9LAMI|nr:hypothetical protein CDL12_17304 [Handroanthus impetiginosus]